MDDEEYTGSPIKGRLGGQQALPMQKQEVADMSYAGRLKRLYDQLGAQQGQKYTGSTSGMGGMFQKMSWTKQQSDATQSLKDQIAALEKEQGYSNDVDTQKGRLMAQAEESGRGQLAEQLAGVKRGAQSRGLLYSGLKQQGDASSYGQYAAQLGQQAAGYNQQARDKMATYKGEQVNRGLDQYQLDQEKAAADYTSALNKRKLAQSQQGEGAKTGAAVGGALGMAAGFI